MAIVYEPRREHNCRTPWGPGGPLEGAVWQCDDCGKTWVSLGAAHSRWGDLTVKWREERRGERRRRERRLRSSDESEQR